MSVATDTAGLAVYHAATIRDEHGFRTVGYWGEPNGEPITDPARLRQLEARMAKARANATFEADDRVLVLDDDGNERDDFPPGRVVDMAGPGTYLIELDDRRTVGVPETHLKAAD